MAEKENPKFRVGGGRFFDGQKLYEPGEEIEWAVPEGWDAAKNGPHPHAHGPSHTFVPLNEAARALQEHHAERIKRANVPQLSESEKMQALMIEQNKQIAELLKAFTEAQKRR